MILPPSPFEPDTTRAILVGLAVAFLLFVIVHALLDGSSLSSYVKASRRRRKERGEASNKTNSNNHTNSISKEPTNVVNG